MNKTMMRGVAMAVLLLAGGTVMAQEYPTKPIKIIVPFPAGGTTDVLARLVAERMTDSLGKTVFVSARRLHPPDA
jgi:tripartite-type tricarboxylate transporter receptor subunit TctC